MTKYKKVFIVVLFLIVLILGTGNVRAFLNCDYKDEPFLELTDSKIEWICKTNELFCLSYVEYNDRLLQVNPEPETVVGIGVVDKFTVNDGMVKVHFTKKNLRHNVTFDFGVKCGDDTLEVNITPQYRDLYEIQDQAVRVKDSTKFIALGFFVVLFLIIIVFLVVKFFKRKR